MSTFEPTQEQQDIVAAFQTGEDVVVEAGAGTGKTSTLVLLAEEIPRGKKALYLAFNKAIQVEADGRFPANTRCSTAHSLAWQAVVKDNPVLKKRLAAGRVDFKVTKTVLAFDGPLQLGTEYLSLGALHRAALDTVKRFCWTSDTEITRKHVPFIKKVSDQPGAVDGFGNTARDLLNKVVVPAARRAWEDITSPTGVLAYTHDHYLKQWCDTNPTLPFDVIFFDEAQDANPILSDLVSRQSHAQRVIVGDTNQQIYAWRGAVDAIATFDGIRLQLTESWRFGQEIADAANDLLNLLESTLTIVGRGKPGNVYVDSPEEPDAVLTRTNAGAIEVLLHALENERPAHLVGGSADIKGFCLAAQDLQFGKRVTYPDLAAFASWPEVVRYCAEDPGSDDIAVLVRLVDRFTPRVIVEALDRTVSELQAEVVISTAHKAKGREWKRVQIHSDFEPSIDKKTGEFRPPTPEELRLAYVAITRAKKWVAVGPLTEYITVAEFEVEA